MPEAFEIHLSRRATLFFVACASLLLWFGLEVAFLHKIFSPDQLTAQPVFVYLLAAVFLGVIPISIIARQIPYLIHPPLLLRVDKDFVTFGTGWGYTPTRIPTHALRDVHVCVATPDASKLRLEQLVSLGGVVLLFDTKEDLPTNLATSAGIQFSFGRLVVSRFYGNTSLKKSVAAIKPFCSTSS
ncbi:TPA: hypothetical protein DEB00_00195 [Candidatus Uhrbacteria bacterium]|nr:hypothetical protein [Candidatus Uhrbacteria bacterium]